MHTSKIQKASRIIDRFLRVLQGFMIAFSIVSAVFILLAFTVGEKIVQDASSITLGQVTVKLTENAIPPFSALRKGIVGNLIAVILMCAVGWYLLRVVRQLLHSMKEGRPFDPGISRSINRLAWTTLVGGFIIELCHSWGILAELKAYDLGILLNPDVVTGVSLRFIFRTDFLLVSGILFFLALVFRYGEQLQQESDETL